jgi:Icc-related predicted phosphoesterase
MKLALTSDTHCQHDRLTVPSCDVLIHAGDWTGRGKEWETIDFLKWFESQTQAKTRIFISGNHDFLCETHPSEFRELIAKHAPTCIYLEDEAVLINGRKFYGSPVSPWFHSWAFNAHRGQEIQEYWAKIPADTNVLITHGPVLGYGDKLSRWGSEPGKHIGCADLLDTINTRLTHLELHVSGHIHEGAGTYEHYSPFGRVRLVNASALDDHYDFAHEPTVIELP